MAGARRSRARRESPELTEDQKFDNFVGTLKSMPSESRAALIDQLNSQFVDERTARGRRIEGAAESNADTQRRIDAAQSMNDVDELNVAGEQRLADRKAEHEANIAALNEAGEAALAEREAAADRAFADSVEMALAEARMSEPPEFAPTEEAPVTQDAFAEAAAEQDKRELEATFESSIESAVGGSPEGTDVSPSGEAASEAVSEEPTVDEDTLMADFKVAHGSDFDPNSEMDRGKLAQLESARQAYPNETSTQIALRIYRGEFD